MTAENKFAAQKEIDLRDGRLSLYVEEEPVTLIGFGGQIREDRSVSSTCPAGRIPAGRSPAGYCWKTSIKPRNGSICDSPRASNGPSLRRA